MLPCELLESKVSNLREFVKSHPYFELFCQKLSLVDGIKMRGYLSVPIESPMIMREYKDYLMNFQKTPEEERWFEFYRGEKKSVWVWKTDKREAKIQEMAEELSVLHPNVEDWPQRLLNDANKILLYLNFIHDFYCKASLVE